MTFLGHRAIQLKHHQKRHPQLPFLRVYASNQPLALANHAQVATDLIAIHQAAAVDFTFKRQLLMPSEAELRAELERDRALLECARAALGE
jgi:hypothetical protein